MRGVFVAGTHTDIGKTFVACALVRAARAQGLRVAALKPVVSGFDPDDWTQSDPGRLLDALGHPRSQAALEAISLRRFRAPLSPPMAARLEGVRLELAELVGFCVKGLAAPSADLAVVEGVGGLMSPVAEDGTGLDLILALGLPTVLVGGTYLGAISHTLTAIEVLRSRGAEIAAVVISQSADADAPDFAQSVASVAAFAGGAKVLSAARDDATSWPVEII